MCQDPRHFFSGKLSFDFQAMVLGLEAVRIKITVFPGTVVKPGINQKLL